MTARQGLELVVHHGRCIYVLTVLRAGIVMAGTGAHQQAPQVSDLCRLQVSGWSASADTLVQKAVGATGKHLFSTRVVTSYFLFIQSPVFVLMCAIMFKC